ncbi:MAG: tetratricopeptide repeat protein [bacterium]|nr:tetratricopeptide repeat protein [bacterium]
MLSSSGSMFSRGNLPSILITAFSTIYLLAVTLPVSSVSSLWGMNLLSYFDWSVRLPIALASIAGASAVILLGARLNLYPQLKKILLYVALPCTLIAIFYLLRVKTHYLGDGLLRAKELEVGIWWLPTEPLAQFANYIVFKVTSVLFGFSGTTAIETVSYIGGLFYCFGLLYFVRTICRDTSAQLLTFVLLYFSGMTVLFCGYAETYMLLPGLMAIFFASGVKAANGQSSPLAAYTLFLLIVLFHFKSLMLAPCVAYLVYADFRENRSRWAVAGVMTIIAAIASAVLIPRMSDLPILSASEFLLPFAAGGTEYTMFSKQHLLDILSQLLLISAAPLIVLVASIFFVAKPRTDFGRATYFAAWALPGAVCMLLFLHSRLGFAVDWDLFSAATLAISFFAMTYVARFEQIKVMNSVAAVALASVALVSFFGFAAVNSQTDIAIKRQVDTLNLYGKEGAIGFESMGNHLNSIGRPELAEQMWRKSLFLRPHVRLYANLAQLSLNEGRITDARYFSEMGLALDSTSAPLWNHRGVALSRMGESEASDSSFTKALHFNPNDANYHHNYSILLTQAERWSEAEAQSREALRLKPNDLTIMIGLGIALTNAGKIAEAEDVLTQITIKNPAYGESYFHLGRIYLAQADTAKLLQVLGDYVRRYPDSPTTPKIKLVVEGVQSAVRENQ